MEPSRRTMLEMKGMAWNKATLRLSVDPRFNTTLTLQELCDRLAILERFMQTHGAYDPATARKDFINEKQQALDGYVKDEMIKLADLQKLKENAVDVGKRIVMDNFVPFINGQRVKWTDKITDTLTQQQTPNIITMVYEVADIGNIDSILRPDKFMDWLRTSFADYEHIFRYERQLTLTQKEQNEKDHAEVVIICKPVLLK